MVASEATGGLSWFLWSVSPSSVYAPHLLSTVGLKRRGVGGGASRFPCDRGIGMHQSQGGPYPYNNGCTISALSSHYPSTASGPCITLKLFGIITCICVGTGVCACETGPASGSMQNV